MSKLYALFDFELNQKYNKSIKEFVELCKKLDARIIQYRDKINSFTIKKQNLLMIRELWDKTLLVNDEVDLTEFCDGVHLGQEDLAKIHHDKKKALHMIREIVDKKIIGLSTHNKDEILQANKLDVDYIGLGAYRETSTKKDIRGVLGNRIENLCKLSKKPVAVIGGVKVNDNIDFAKYRVVGSDLYLYY